MKAIRGISILLIILIAVSCLGGCGSDEPQTTDFDKTSASTRETTVLQPTASKTDDSVGTPTESETVSQDVTTVIEPAVTTSAGSNASVSETKPVSSGKATTTATTAPAKTTPAKTTTAKTTVVTQPQSNPQPTPDPVTLKALSVKEYYGYQYLAQKGGNAVAVYECVTAGVADMKTEISLENAGLSISETDLKSVMRCYHADYPQHFWYDGAYSYVVNGSGDVLSVKPTYTMSVSQKQTAQGKVDKAVEELLAKAAYGQTEYQRELILHDALADRVKYIDGTNAHNLYGALVEGKAVCEGYARAFQYLLYQAGTQCLFVEGTSVPPGGSKGQAHAWNVVEINGKYYHTDVTWDNQSDAAVSVVHAFFNLNDALINEGHTISEDNAYPVPVCNSTSDSYFVKEGTEVKTFTVDKIAELFAKGNGTATVFVSQKTVNEFLTWFQTNVSAISSKAQLSGKTFSLQYCGREVIITAQ